MKRPPQPGERLTIVWNGENIPSTVVASYDDTYEVAIHGEWNHLFVRLKPDETGWLYPKSGTCLVYIVN